jgi:hypothetical protein
VGRCEPRRARHLENSVAGMNLSIFDGVLCLFEALSAHERPGGERLALLARGSELAHPRRGNERVRAL